MACHTFKPSQWVMMNIVHRTLIESLILCRDLAFQEKQEGDKMESKSSSQKQRYVEGLKTCVIIMIILLIITVAISTLSSYIGQRSIDPSKFDANIDIRKEFSVPYYSCPVEIDVSIIYLSFIVRIY